MPAGTGSISKITGAKPISARSWAAASPAGPEPTIAMRSPAALVNEPRVLGSRGDTTFNSSAECGLKTPFSGSVPRFPPRFPVRRSVSQPTIASTRSSPASAPKRSVTKRLSARIWIGLSISPRRQALSHGAPQMRPHTEASGLGARAIR